MKKIVFPIVLAVLLAGVGSVMYQRMRQNLSPKDTGTLVLHGNVDIREVNLAFQAAERIAEILVEEGQQVKKGQLLGRLETEMLSLAVKRHEAMLEVQRQVVKKLEAGSRKEEIQKARAEVEAARRSVINAQRTYDRLKSLVKKNLTSRQNADDALSRLEIEQARLQAVTEGLNLVLAGPRTEDIDAARARLAALEAELAIARKNLADASLFSPSDGIIQSRVLQVGDMASPIRPAFILALTDPVWVRTYIPETELGKVFAGMKAKIETDSFPDKDYSGWVGYISPSSEFTPKTVQTPEIRTQLVYRIKVIACNPENQLRLGMPATVIIPMNQTEKQDFSLTANPCQEDGGKTSEKP